MKKQSGARRVQPYPPPSSTSLALFCEVFFILKLNDLPLNGCCDQKLNQGKNTFILFMHI
ncbi:hypothetical protein AOLI_G00069660 [Acnodon oligacanthus]